MKWAVVSLFFGEKHALVHAACNEYIVVHATVAEPSHAALRYCWTSSQKPYCYEVTSHNIYFVQ